MPTSDETGTCNSLQYSTNAYRSEERRTRIDDAPLYTEVACRVGTLEFADQNANTNASCPTRGFTAVALITPNVDDAKLVSGLAN